MKKANVIMIGLAILIFASIASATPRNFRHEHIIATLGFEGDISSCTNLPQAGVQGLVTDIANLKGATGSLDIVVGNLNAATGSLNVAVAALNGATGSLNTAVGNLNAATGSMTTAIGNLNASTGVLNTAVGNLNASTGSLNTAVGNLNSATGSLNVAVSEIQANTNTWNAGGTGATIGGHMLLIEAGGTVDTYAVVGNVTTWLGSTFP